MQRRTRSLALGLAAGPLLAAIGSGPAAAQEDPFADAPASAYYPYASGPGFSVGGVVRAFYGYSDDTIGTMGGDTVSSVVLEEAQPYVEYATGNTIVRVNFEMSSGSVELEDAYVAMQMKDWLGVKVGNFKPRVLQSASADPETIVFRNRTILGERFDFFDEGVEVTGYEDPFRWFLAVQNGPDGTGDGYFSSARLEWSSYEDELGLGEGQRGAPDYLICDVGFFGFFDSATDSSVFDAGGFGLDLTLTMGAWYGHMEFCHLEDNFLQVPVPVHGNPVLFLEPDSNPFSMTLGRAHDERWVGMFRWERTGDSSDTDHLALAVNHFPNKSSLAIIGDLSYYESRGPSGWVYSIGMSFGANRPSRVREY